MSDEALGNDLKSRSVATDDAKHTCLQENSTKYSGRNAFYMRTVFINFMTYLEINYAI